MTKAQTHRKLTAWAKIWKGKKYCWSLAWIKGSLETYVANCFDSSKTTKHQHKHDISEAKNHLLRFAATRTLAENKETKPKRSFSEAKNRNKKLTQKAKSGLSGLSFTKKDGFWKTTPRTTPTLQEDLFATCPKTLKEWQKQNHIPPRPRQKEGGFAKEAQGKQNIVP